MVYSIYIIGGPYKGNILLKRPAKKKVGHHWLIPTNDSILYPYLTIFIKKYRIGTCKKKKVLLFYYIFLHLFFGIK